MLYIVGLGLDLKGISLEGREVVKSCKKIYLENYTVEFPYSDGELRRVLGKKVVSLNRDRVESNKIVKEAKKEDVCLLVYGSPFFATTHISIIEECKLKRVKYKIIYSASVFDALGESGLQLYKFGKIASMPKWDKSYKPDSFISVVKENFSINAHSLILVDIGLGFKEALGELKESDGEEFGKVVVCSRMGSEKSKIYYGSLEDLKRLRVNAPFCFIIPGKMHFMEEDFLRRLEV